MPTEQGIELRALFSLLVLITCAGCASSGVNNVPLSITDLAVPDNTSLVQSGDMRVSPLDVVEIKVFGSNNLDGSYQVDPNGEIKFPLIGGVVAKGYTTFELANLLESRLKEKYLQNPLVTVRITEVNGQQFTIEGAIGKPGMYPVRGPLTLLQALALSGGPAGNANLEGILLFRTVEGKRQAARFDLRKIRAGESVDPVIYGNDIIVVDGYDTTNAYDGIMRSLPVLGMFKVFF